MSTQLSPQQQSIIDHLVTSGAYADASEAIDWAIHLLELHDRQLRELRATLQVGLEQAERGELIPYTPEFMDELIREVEEAYQRGETPDPNAWP
jgi:antitoxin ParD1/3/4